MSQSWNVSDIIAWDDNQFRQNLSDALSIVVKSIQEADNLEESLQVLCLKIVPLYALKELEDAVFSKITESLQGCYSVYFDEIIEILSEADSKKQLLSKQLKRCETMVSSLDSCLGNFLKRCPQEKSAQISTFHSLYTPVVHIISISYQHCKDSGSIYGSLIGQVSEVLSSFFKKVYSLHTKFLSLLEILCQHPMSTSDDIKDFCYVILGLHQLSRVASSLDVKIVVSTWKAISRLILQHKSSLLAHLDVSVLLGGLATDMEVTLNYLAAIHSETSADEDKSSGRQIKVLGFQMRILSSVSREYNSLSLSCESCVALHSLLIAINRNCPYDSTTWFHLEIKNQLTGAALMPLVSALLLQENFCQYALSITPEGKDYLPAMRTFFLICDAMSKTDQDLSQWCEPNSKSLFHKLLDNFPPVGEFDSLELRKEFSLAGSMLINYYPTKCTQNLERLLLSYTIGSKYPEQTFMVIDLWVLLARRGGTQLIYEHCVFLIDLLGSITIIPTLPQVSYIIFLLRRLLKILPENLKASLAKTCSIDVCARVLPTFYQVKADFDRLEKWRNLTTGQDALNLNSCLVRLSFATFDDVTSSKKASSCLMPLWSYLIEENLQHTSVFTVLQAICVSICHVYKSIAAKCSDILRVLELLSKTLTEAKENKWSCLDELMLAALSLLKSLSSRSFAEANHKSILNLLSDLFYRLLAEEEHPVVRHAALETFAYFAEQTSHESVVAESLQRDDGVQERVVTYLNQISDPASYTSTNSISRSAFLLTQREHSQNALPFHVGKWPETNSSHVNPPADKRPRLSNRPITPPSSRSANPSDPRSIYIHLEQSVSQLEECMPLPFGFRSKLNTLCRRLKLLADTTSS